MKLSTNTKSQCDRLLEALRVKPVTTIDAREDLDIYYAPARIFTLRHERGCEIDMVKVWQDTKPNHPHKVGQYTLIREISHA